MILESRNRPGRRSLASLLKTSQKIGKKSPKSFIAKDTPINCLKSFTVSIKRGQKNCPDNHPNDLNCLPELQSGLERRSPFFGVEERSDAGLAEGVLLQPEARLSLRRLGSDLRFDLLPVGVLHLALSRTFPSRIEQLGRGLGGNSIGLNYRPKIAVKEFLKRTFVGTPLMSIQSGAAG